MPTGPDADQKIDDLLKQVLLRRDKLMIASLCMANLAFIWLLQVMDSMAMPDNTRMAMLHVCGLCLPCFFMDISNK